MVKSRRKNKRKKGQKQGENKGQGNTGKIMASKGHVKSWDMIPKKYCGHAMRRDVRT
jgi:hypothetical protein